MKLKVIRFFVLMLFFISIFSMVSAKDQSISINYDPVVWGNDEFDIDYSDVKVKVNTEVNSICKYSKYEFDYGDDSDDVKIFDLTGNKNHYFDLLSLGDGIYEYNIKCKNGNFSGEPESFELVLKVNSLVKAQIVLDEEAPLKEGRVNVKLVTSKPVSSTPSLTYSFDGDKYNPLVLVGSGKIWEGSIVLDNSLKEGVLSFKFNANDLEGRRGSEITVGSYFDYDLVEPKMITDIKAISREDEIKLEWYYDDSYDEFRIYRSDSSSPDYVDYYKSVDEKEFLDAGVSDGKTYYYRVTAIDEAGNEADLSKEVSGTSLGSSDYVEDGLNPALLGLVESFASEVNSVESEVEAVESRVSSFSEVEKEMFNSFELDKKLDKAKSEVNSIKNNLEKWKSQDLSRDDLVSKIDSARVKLGVSESKMPSDIEILNEASRDEDLSDDKKELALMEINELISEKEKEKSIKETNKFIEENSVFVQSYFYDVEISYLDGKQESYSVVKRDVSGEIEKMKDSYFVERVSSSVEGDFDNLKIRNRNYNIVKESSLFTFDTDTKEIFYYVPRVSNFEELREIEFSFVKIIRGESGSTGITGFSILESEGINYVGIFGGIVLFLILIYFVFFKGDYSDDYFRILNRISQVRDLIESKNYEKAKEVYLGIKRMYGKLKKKEKKSLYPKLESVYNDILISEIEDNLIVLKKTNDKKLIPKIEAKIKSLPKEKGSKVLDVFEKIKEEVNSSSAS